MQVQPRFGPIYGQGPRESSNNSKADSIEKSAAYAFVFVLILVLVVLAPPPIFRRSSDFILMTALDSGGDIVTQAIYVTTFLVVLSIAFLHRETKPFSFLLPVALAIPLLWCWLSIFWAEDLALSARRILFTSMIVMMVAYLVRILGATKILNLLFWTYLAILIGDWLVMPFFSAAVQKFDVIEAGEGGWRGLQSDKNTAGPFCAIAIIIFLHPAIIRRHLLISLLGGVAGFGFLWMTNSKTSIGFLPVAFVGGLVVDFLYKHPFIRGVAGVLLIFALALIFMSYGNTILGSITSTVDDPAAFTGRSQIWSLALAYANDHFLLGSGYGAFWAAGDSSPAAQYGSGWVVDVPEAHNGYLDVTIQTGVIGLGVAVVSLIIVPFHWLLSARLSHPEYRSLLASFLIFLMLHNFLETSLLDKANGMWVMMIILITLTSDLRCVDAPPVVNRPASANACPPLIELTPP